MESEWHLVLLPVLLAGVAMLMVVDGYAVGARLEVPAMYVINCGRRECDGRTFYCNDPIPGYETCERCTKICGGFGSIPECQDKCRKYLEFEEKKAILQTLNKTLEASIEKVIRRKLNGTLNTLLEIDSIKDEVSVMTKDLERLEAELKNERILNRILYSVIVCAVVVVICGMVRICRLLPKEREKDYGKVATNDNDSGIGPVGGSKNSSTEVLSRHQMPSTTTGKAATVTSKTTQFSDTNV